MLKIKTIETDRYEEIPDSRYVKHVGMIKAEEAFAQLQAHLESHGLMPDEYFLFNSSVEAVELPNFATAVCRTDWGGSEGIYIDIELMYRDNNRNLQVFNLATGKTLGESGDDFMRMSRIAAECSMMLNGRGSYVKVSETQYDIFPEEEQIKPSLSAQIENAAAKTNAAAPDHPVPEKEMGPEL